MARFSAPHRRGNAGRHINRALETASTLNPGVSVDGIQARIFIPHTKLVVGRGPYRSLHTAPFRWLDEANGKIGIRSLDCSSVLLRFNPAQLEFGHNIWRCSARLSSVISATFRRILPRVPELSLDRKSSSLLRAGHVHLSGLHICSDFRFAKYDGSSQFFREIKAGWRWSRGRIVDNKYATGMYFHQRRWSLVAYDKAEQLDRAFPAMPDWMRTQSQKRLRIELRLGRQELRTLGARLQRAYPNFPLLDLGMACEWQESLFCPVFDLYASRIRPAPGPHAAERVPLYGLLADLRASSLWTREVQDADPNFE